MPYASSFSRGAVDAPAPDVPEAVDDELAPAGDEPDAHLDEVPGNPHPDADRRHPFHPETARLQKPEEPLLRPRLDVRMVVEEVERVSLLAPEPERGGEHRRPVRRFDVHPPARLEDP